MDRLEYILTKVAEEANEIGQEAAKCNVFGLFHIGPDRIETNIQRLWAETHDLLATLQLLDEEFHLNLKPQPGWIEAKTEKLNYYYDVAQKLRSRANKESSHNEESD